MKNDSAYIKIDEAENLIHTSGITFNEFVQGLQLKNMCYLILAGFPDKCNFSMELLLEYVTKEDANALANEYVYGYGDFCWVDFEYEDQLKFVTKEELAKMLYMGHMKKALDDYKITSLNNRYAYLCHDDGWYNNVYMDKTCDYKKVIAYKLVKELKGRKRRMEIPDEEQLSQIYEKCKLGAVIDFERANSDCVYIYTVGNIGTMDELENKMDRFRNKNNGLCFSYNSRKGVWKIY